MKIAKLILLLCAALLPGPVFAVPVKVPDNTAFSGATVSLSTTLPGYPAGNATDGNIYSFTNTTDNDPDPTWSAVFSSPTSAQYFRLWNRQDCCQDRFADITFIAYSDAAMTTEVYNSGILPATAYANFVDVDFGSVLTINAIKVTRSPASTPAAGIFSLGGVQLINIADLALPPGTDLTSKLLGLPFTASQSSNLGGYPASNGIDDNYNNFTHTDFNGDINPWWELNLGGDFNLSSVLLYNRAGCCPERLRDVNVVVYDSSNNIVFASPLLNPANVLTGPDSIFVDLRALNGGQMVTGGKIRVTRTSDGRGDYVLSLREVKVYGATATEPLLGTNLTRYAAGLNAAGISPVAAGQSSQLGGYAASFAIDGVTGDGGNFTHTNDPSNDSWWEVNLGYQFDLSTVKFENRAGCCPERMRDIIVTVKNTDGSTAFTSPLLNPANALGGPAFIEIDLAALNGGNLVRGQYVRITRQRDTNAGGGDDFSTLSLSEVTVIGGVRRVINPSVNVVSAPYLATAAVRQSSEYGGFPASNAVNGINGDFTHTGGGDVNPYWEVDLGEKVYLESVNLHNREGCCPDRLSDITVTITNPAGTVVFTSALLNPGNSLNGPADLFLDLKALNGGAPIIGKKLRVTRTTSDSVLSLAEVTLTGYNTPPPAADLRLVNFAYDSVNDQVFLEWTSQPGFQYKVSASPDLVTWFDSVPLNASAGSTTTYTNEPHLSNPPDFTPLPRLFFRVKTFP